MSRNERLTINPTDRKRLEGLVGDRNTPQKVVWRARIVLAAGSGAKAGEIADMVGKSAPTIRRWRRRFVATGVDGLLCDASRPPGLKRLPAKKVQQVIDMTTRQKPPHTTHWNIRSMATAANISRPSVQRIWRSHGLKPNRVRTFKLSRDPNFVAKLQDVVGLLLKRTPS